MNSVICTMTFTSSGQVKADYEEDFLCPRMYFFLADRLLETIIGDGVFKLREKNVFLNRYKTYMLVDMLANHIRMTHSIDTVLCEDFTIYPFSIALHHDEKNYYFDKKYKELDTDEKTVLLASILGLCTTQQEQRMIELIGDELYFDVVRRAERIIQRGGESCEDRCNYNCG